MSESLEIKPHQAVLVEQVLEHLSPVSGGRYLDGTLGFGGHISAVLEKTNGVAEVVGLDQDQQALDWTAKELRNTWPQSQIVLRHERFSRFSEVLDELGWDKLDGALLDLGFSSFQVDTPERGFSFLADGPLDMRMDPQGTALTAREVVNAFPVRELARIIGEFGEEPLAGKIARRIDEYRQYAHIASTRELAGIVEQAYPPARRAQARNHPATRTFQALRMFVNDEVGELTRFLDAIVPYLAENGRVVIISFHSIEDRIVKHFFLNHAKKCLCPPRQPYCLCGHTATLKVLTKKPVMASDEENLRNPRSRSAKLRAAQRI
ncbi:16S rRNA (cytosine1402-N4)-methyltransferase [Desulfonatronum thiosulfatophilum]|uniref:Ribosomal RNA small subunit methyltransferase H n=1 Tax=Desulfonatronum thiosulfatophilum TaxID=617002 RepID=A0A1G6ANM0_9BACT|nr:16S rRNA (cytosine(1402)-N(4))-methyltransferase RsmH [Desulfonatronum thiosulfatophilum]SDB09959.1 16S rRNA (cytosine1402-N4)-methyltransferase [Desulfonatronum thiosulfatophilum]